MSFNESFWVVTGAASPVIALAAVVHLGDAGEGLERFRSRITDDRAFAAVRRSNLGRLYGGFMTLDYVNMVAQGLVLLASLFSLLNHSNFFGPVIAILLTFIGVLVLAGTNLGAVLVRIMWTGLLKREADTARDAAARQDVGEPPSPDAG